MRAAAGLSVALLLVVGCGPSPALDDLPVETFEDQGRAHIPEGTPTPRYDSDPPTSGPHYPAWAPCGVYRQEIPDGYQVHTLEHGAVIVQYDPSLPAGEVERLEDLARELRDHIVVAPRSGMSAPVAATAWARLLELDEVDLDAIRAFHDVFAGQGPERVPCPFEVDQGG